VRTIEEIQVQIDRILKDDEYGDEYDQGQQSEAGRLAGFRRGQKLIAEGKTRDEITAWAQEDDRSYASYGDDYADAWQSGYSTALFWVAEQYDWDDDGNAIRRPDSIFPAENW